MQFGQICYVFKTQGNQSQANITVDIFNNLSFFYPSESNPSKASSQIWMKLVTDGICISSEM